MLYQMYPRKNIIKRSFDEEETTRRYIFEKIDEKVAQQQKKCHIWTYFSLFCIHKLEAIL